MNDDIVTDGIINIIIDFIIILIIAITREKFCFFIFGEKHYISLYPLLLSSY